MKYKILILSAVILLVTACQQDTTDNNIQGQTYSDDPYQEASPDDIANHLVQLSTRVPDVDHATAVVIGPYAVVGINVAGDIDQSDVGSIKYSVAETLADDPYGATAVVTADPDIVNRLAEMRDEMADGRPLHAIASELAAIIGRIMPIMPGYEHRQQDDPTNGNDDRISPEGQGELDDIQDEQSKGR